MKARDVMTTHVISALPDMEVRTVANIMARNGISAIPVIDDYRHLLGIVSEGDLVRRAEIGTERRRSWWLELLASDQALAAEYVKSHARKVRDVMTREVVTAPPDAHLSVVARLLEKHSIKRIPIVDGGSVIGIVSRANLVQALANTTSLMTAGENDAGLRRDINRRIAEQPWAHRPFSVCVNNGIADLCGAVYSDEESDAIRVATENTPGVKGVTNNLRVIQQFF